MASSRLKVGISACMMHEDRAARITVFNGKPLYYVEKSMLGMVHGAGAIPILVSVPESVPPAIPGRTAIPSSGTPKLPAAPATMEELVSELDAVIIVGGVDMSPGSYGQTPLQPQWSGDPIRDRYEMELIRTAMKLDRPVLGICRGHQVLNVTLGGTLYQDIQTQVPGSLRHRDQDSYDHNQHRLKIHPDSDLARIYADALLKPEIIINTVHHQAIRDLGKDLVVEAVCPDDGIIEAVRYNSAKTYARGVQWHPEFSTLIAGQMDPWPLIQDLFKAATERKKSRA
ncbi:MAG: gamma-glutamyl-gamma-aminobutyrate hydrolase family protein [Bdellovibrionales bacterium]|nr:gamma-glutamyl-gamma-aminobutyrate hydrolase family protein [Bdellovibrionales bacterium]